MAIYCRDPTRDDGDLDQKGSREVVTCLDSAHILKVKPKVCPGGLDVKYERKQAVKGDYKFWA